MLCRGDLKQSIQVQSQLKCRYENSRTPFLKIAPFKVEEANLEPYILIYHEVLHDHEINIIKSLAKPRVCITSFIQ